MGSRPAANRRRTGVWRHLIRFPAPADRRCASRADYNRRLGPIGRGSNGQQHEVPRGLPGRTDHSTPGPDAQVAPGHRIHRRRPGPGAASGRCRPCHPRRESAPGRHLPQGRHQPRHLRPRGGLPPPESGADDRDDPGRGRHARVPARHRTAPEPEAAGAATATDRVRGHPAGPRRPAPGRPGGGAGTVHHPRAGRTVPAVSRGRRPYPDSVAQRPGPRRDGQRSRPAHAAPPHEGDRHHRGVPGGHPTREYPDGEPARHRDRTAQPPLPDPICPNRHRRRPNRTTSAG